MATVHSLKGIIMKLVRLLAIALSAAATINLAAAVSISPLGPVTVKFTVTGPSPSSGETLSVKTNTTAVSTNITTTFKLSTTNSTIDNGVLLDLLANSFNTNFPSGAQLASSGNSYYVVDSTGTNILLNVSSVLNLDFSFTVSSGPFREIEVNDASGSRTFDVASTTLMMDGTLQYDDESRTTGDGTHTEFTLHGLVLVKRIQAEHSLKASYLFTGSGSGEIRDQQRLLRGTVRGKGSVTF